MNIGILGSGDVGKAITKGFIDKGDKVMIGTREPTRDEFQTLKAEYKDNLTVGTPLEAVGFGEIIVFAVNWRGAQNAINMAGKDNFNGKIVIDITNPADFTHGPLPQPSIPFPESAGKTLQEWLPTAKVVKTLNIVSFSRMVKPEFKEGKPVMFITGNDNDAKLTVTGILKAFGWQDIIDVGDIGQSYLLENFALLRMDYAILNNAWTDAFGILR